MLMAAGLGTRLKPFTEKHPKALMPVLGAPLAQFAVDSLVSAGVKRIVTNVHHHAEMASKGLRALDLKGAEMILSDESKLILGSGGGIRKALPRFGNDPFFLLNADVLCDIDLRALAMRHARLRSRWGVWLTLTVFPRPAREGEYREIFFDDERGLVTGVGELKRDRPFYVGAAVVEPEALMKAPKEGPFEFVPEILSDAIRAGRVGVFLSSGEWHDCGTPALWLEAHLSLIRALETGRISAIWRKRIEKSSHRIAQNIWVSNGSGGARLPAEWAGPAYWGGDWEGAHANPPRIFGPNCVIYGEAPSSATLSGGIGLGADYLPVSFFNSRK